RPARPSGSACLVSLDESVRGQPRPTLWFSYSAKYFEAPYTNPSVTVATAISPTVPTTNGRSPCLRISRRSVLKPTPAKVSKKAQRDKLARLVICGFENRPIVANTDTSRKPKTNLG